MTCPVCHHPALSSWVTAYSDTEAIVHVVHDGHRCNISTLIETICEWWRARKPLGDIDGAKR